MALAAIWAMLIMIACSPRPEGAAGDQETQNAAFEAATLYAPTLEAQMTQYAPTLQAQAAQFASQSSQQTAEANQSPQVIPPTGGAVTTEPGSDQAATSVSSGDLPVFTGGDDYDTTLVERIALGETRTATLGEGELFHAHNWLFEGHAGQAVTISVTGIGGADPSAKLIDPGGNVLSRQQDVDASNVNVVITYTLPMDGIYTIRVDVWVPGDYTVSIQ